MHADNERIDDRIAEGELDRVRQLQYLVSLEMCGERGGR
jgi:hypothetical protein